MTRRMGEKGFGAVPVLIILLALAVVGFGGYYVWLTQKDDKPATAAVQTPAPTPTPPATPAADPTESWNSSYSSSPGAYSFAYPQTWVLADNLDSCSDGLVLLASSKELVGKCASEDFGQIVIASEAGDGSGKIALAKTSYPDLQTKDVKSNRGVTGKRYSGTFKVASGEDFGFGPADGTKTVQYVYYTNGRTYYATYYREPGEPDITSDFDALMTYAFAFAASKE